MRRMKRIGAGVLALGALSLATGPALTAAAAATTQANAAAEPSPVSTVTLDGRGRPVFSPRSFRLRLESENGCSVTIRNETPATLALTYGTPGPWKRLPFGTIAPDATGGAGVGIAPCTGYFSAMGAANHVEVRCV